MIKILLIATAVLCMTNLNASELGRVIFGKDKNLLVIDVLADGQTPEQLNKSKLTKSNKSGKIEKSSSNFKVNQMSELLVQIKDPKTGAIAGKNYRLISFDARMPEHNHGMIVTPKIDSVSPGVWKIRGFKLHMKGSWRLLLEFSEGVDKETVILDVLL